MASSLFSINFDFFFINNFKKKRNEELYDKYGYSFILETTPLGLKEFLNDMENEKEAFQINDDLKHLKKKLKEKIIVEAPVFE